MIRVFDFLFASIGLILLSPLFVILYIIGFFDTGSPIFRQERVGKNMRPFDLLKFRSMLVDTQSVATHLVQTTSITAWGTFLRKSKLDELPQLYNVLIGDMSFVGPRPNLYNQTELITARSEKKVYSVRPGITGLAQIKKIDMSTPDLLANTDSEMIQNFDLEKYFKIIFLTLSGKGWGDRAKY